VALMALLIDADLSWIDYGASIIIDKEELKSKNLDESIMIK
jgi:hypothetical protein